MNCERVKELMMDYLYQELDGQTKAAFEAALEGCPDCAKELSSLQEMRSVFRTSLTDEEPPDALSNMLMEQARQHAPTTEERPGFLAWLGNFMGQVGHHPAMAAVASLVLIGGVAGYFALTGTVSVDSQTVSDPRQDEAPISDPAVKSPAPPKSKENKNGLPGAAPMPEAENDLLDEAAPADMAKEQDAKRNEEEPPFSIKADRPRSKRGKGPIKREQAPALPRRSKSKLEARPKPSSLESKMAPQGVEKAPAPKSKKMRGSYDEAETGRQNSGGAGVVGGVSAEDSESDDDGFADEGTRKDAPAEEPAAPAAAPQNRDEGGVGQTKTRSTKADPARLYGQMVKAAKEGRCSEALRYEAQLRKISPSYYKKRVNRSRDLAGCLGESKKKKK